MTFDPNHGSAPGRYNVMPICPQIALPHSDIVVDFYQQLQLHSDNHPESGKPIINVNRYWKREFIDIPEDTSAAPTSCMTLISPIILQFISSRQ